MHRFLMCQTMNVIKLIVSALFLWSAIPGVATAQRRNTDANIYGHVISRETGEHLAYINILVKGTTAGTATDASGHYFLKNLPEGEFTVEASFIGYAP